MGKKHQTDTQARPEEVSVRPIRRVLALIGRGKGGNVTSAWWQVTLCDPTWHVSFRSGVAKLFANCHIQLLTLLQGPRGDH